MTISSSRKSFAITFMAGDKEVTVIAKDVKFTPPTPDVIEQAISVAVTHELNTLMRDLWSIEWTVRQ